MASALPMLDSNLHADKITSEIFSILENKFLFGNTHFPLHHFNPSAHPGKVRILSIDGGDPFLAAASLAHLESSLRRHSPSASLSDFFDIGAGSGSGGILAALLFTRGPDNRPILSAADALHFVVENREKLFSPSPSGILRRALRTKPAKILRKVFGEATLKDTCKAVLIPCYDLTTSSAFVFSRADALETNGYDFKMRDVCAATLASRALEMRSVDGHTKISAVGGDVVMNNPTAAAITHVLNNKHEFPFCNGVDNLLVMSLGNGESGLRNGNVTSSLATGLVQIAGEGASDLVDQSVSMAFGESRASNYVRIQTNGAARKLNKGDLLGMAQEMLTQKNVESVLFQGKRLAKSTNLEKLQTFARELINEHERRKTSILPTVVLKHGSPSPRTSSATTLSSLSSN